jgi:hypothetical protein
MRFTDAIISNCVFIAKTIFKSRSRTNACQYDWAFTSKQQTTSQHGGQLRYLIQIQLKRLQKIHRQFRPDNELHKTILQTEKTKTPINAGTVVKTPAGTPVSAGTQEPQLATRLIMIV